MTLIVRGAETSRRTRSVARLVSSIREALRRDEAASASASHPRVSEEGAVGSRTETTWVPAAAEGARGAVGGNDCGTGVRGDAGVRGVVRQGRLCMVNLAQLTLNEQVGRSVGRSVVRMCVCVLEASSERSHCFCAAAGRCTGARVYSLTRSLTHCNNAHSLAHSLTSGY